MPLPSRVIWQAGVVGWTARSTKACIPFLYTFVGKMRLLQGIKTNQMNCFMFLPIEINNLQLMVKKG
jgi:hypothetical protein